MLNWLLQEAADITVPPETWLSPAEGETLAGLRVAKRRGDWLLGRWTAKRLLQKVAEARTGVVWPLAQIEIAPRPDGSPQVVQPGLPLALSISHSHGRAFCAVREGDPEQSLGADIEWIATRPAGFVADYFTKEEAEFIAQAPAHERDMLVTLIWSGKEACLKAIRQGLRLDTRHVGCLPHGSWGVMAVWQPLQVWEAEGGGHTRPWQGWWRREAGFVLTMACL